MIIVFIPTIYIYKSPELVFTCKVSVTIVQHGAFISDEAPNLHRKYIFSIPYKGEHHALHYLRRDETLLVTGIRSSTYVLSNSNGNVNPVVKVPQNELDPDSIIYYVNVYIHMN